MRRYEILIPLNYNDGSLIEEIKFHQTRRELINKFGGLTLEPIPIQGFWSNLQVTYKDTLIRYCIDVEAFLENHEFFIKYKEILKERFRQEDIWISFYDIGII